MTTTYIYRRLKLMPEKSRKRAKHDCVKNVRAKTYCAWSWKKYIVRSYAHIYKWQKVKINWLICTQTYGCHTRAVTCICTLTSKHIFTYIQTYMYNIHSIIYTYFEIFASFIVLVFPCHFWIFLPVHITKTQVGVLC